MVEGFGPYGLIALAVLIILVLWWAWREYQFTNIISSKVTVDDSLLKDPSLGKIAPKLFPNESKDAAVKRLATIYAIGDHIKQTMDRPGSQVSNADRLAVFDHGLKALKLFIDAADPAAVAALRGMSPFGEVCIPDDGEAFLGDQMVVSHMLDLVAEFGDYLPEVAKFLLEVAGHLPQCPKVPTAIDTQKA